MNRVLIIEPDNTSRLLFLAALRRGDFAVTAVADTDGAIAELESPRPFDVVIMGRETPGSEGLDLLYWLRRQPQFAQTRILVLSGSGTREEEIAALDGGADAFLTKPVDAALLRAQVRASVRRAGQGGLEPGGAAPGRAA